MTKLDAPLSSLKGVGEKTEKLFKKMGVYSVRSMLLFFPRDYRLYPPLSEVNSLESGKTSAVLGTIISSPSLKRYKNFSICMANVETYDGIIEVVWYRMPYLRNLLKRGLPYVFYGRVNVHGSKLRLEQPYIFSPDDYENIRKKPEPVYRLTSGISNKNIIKVVDQALSFLDGSMENLPEYLLAKRNLMSLDEAIRKLHKPESMDDVRAAHDRMAYNEILKFFLEMNLEEAGKTSVKNSFKLEKHEISDQVIERLPFTLTEGQLDALKDIYNDFSSDTVTERLVQGDVGCGKTVIAFLAMVRMAENGYQSAIMAPTEVLAKQHYETFKKYIKEFDLPFTAELLTGSIKAKERTRILSELEKGKTDFLIGTHALIQDAVSYNKLALVITDEQHRFGVKQRKTFLAKGEKPFSILLTATPIPRSLALILYDGMNISKIKTVPSGRQKIKTAVIGIDLRMKAWQMIVHEVECHHQAYIICPLIEASENANGENVTDYEMKLREVLPPEITTGVLHGRLKSDEKQKVLDDFSSGKTDILISTTVVEVGVNVANATVMMVEDAQKFGLSALHQLRGRVGRSSFQSYCILVNTSEKNQHAMERLMTLRNSTDGFFIAEEDLRQRGPGDFHGIRQSGDFGFDTIDIYQDSEILFEAREDADQILKKDPDLTLPEDELLKKLTESGEEKYFTNL